MIQTKNALPGVEIGKTVVLVQYIILHHKMSHVGTNNDVASAQTPVSLPRALLPASACPRLACCTRPAST